MCILPVLLVTLFPAVALATPKLEIRQPIRDFGTVAKGEVLTAKFEIENNGDSPLEIFAAKPTCGCTATEFDKLIMPGKKGSVTAKVETVSFAGPISKVVALQTNDAAAPTPQLIITAIVKPYVEAYPAGFVRFNLLRGAADTQSVTLYTEETGPFSITGVEAPDWITVKQTKLAGADRVPNVGAKDADQYRIDVTVESAKWHAGPLAEKIKVKTSSPKAPEYWISVAGVIRPPYRVEPTAVNFGEVAPSDTASTRVVNIRSNDLKNPRSFQVTKAASSSPAVTATVAPTGNDGEYLVTLQVAKDAAAGELSGSVDIATSDATEPSCTIPFKGTVRAPR